MPPNNVVKMVEFCEQDVAAACAARRHPEEGIELLVPGPGKWVRYGWLDSLLPQYPDRFGIIGRHRIMRQVRVEIERGYAFQPAAQSRGRALRSEA